MIRARSGKVFCAEDETTGETANLVALEPSDVNSDASPMFAGRVGNFLRRIHDGHRILGLTENNRVIAYFWVSEGPAQVPLLWRSKFSVPRAVTYIWDCRTDPEYRGRGFYTRGLNTIRAQSGKCYLAVDDGNDAALKASYRAGFTRPVSRYLGVLLYRLSFVGIDGRWSAHIV